MAVIYSTSRTSERLKRTEQAFPFRNNTETNEIQLLVDTKTRYQRILGFGGAITDAVTNIWSSTSGSRDNILIKQYFGPSSKCLRDLKAIK
jgi:glucosylceramidase